MVLYGTRPEAVKMAPVVEALRRRVERFAVTVCVTAQHREMLDQVQALFGVRADYDLDLMRYDQSLNELASRTLGSVDSILRELRPDWVLVQGDTTTAMIGALVSFHLGLRVGHIEAGLRTGDLGQPFPEEANRRIIDLLATAHFAPTARARDALLAEGVPAESIVLTGNTVVDALLRIARRIPEVALEDQVLITVHRRESLGEPLCRVFRAVRRLASMFPRTRWVCPVHPNPRVHQPAYRILSGIPNVELHAPFNYLDLVHRLRASRLVLTDSGGLQEEAPTFGKPVLVLRDRTERPEGVEAGVARLVGTAPQRIVEEVARLLTDDGAFRSMVALENPYGDGHAAERIADALASEQRAPLTSGTMHAKLVARIIPKGGRCGREEERGAPETPEEDRPQAEAG